MSLLLKILFPLYVIFTIFRQKNGTEKSVRFAPDPSLCSGGVQVLE